MYHITCKDKAFYPQNQLSTLHTPSEVNQQIIVKDLSLIQNFFFKLSPNQHPHLSQKLQTLNNISFHTHCSPWLCVFSKLQSRVINYIEEACKELDKTVPLPTQILYMSCPLSSLKMVLLLLPQKIKLTWQLYPTAIGTKVIFFIHRLYLIVQLKSLHYKTY